MAYTYDTRHDRTLFAEDTSTGAIDTGGNTHAPPRSVGVMIACYQHGTTTGAGSLTTGKSGWVEAQTLNYPVVDIVTTGGTTTIYSREWIRFRGRSFRPVVHPTPDTVPTDMRLPGDWSVQNGALVYWDGTTWRAK